ncbi:uncharacterized protein TRAVEDRAFT_54834 [Trametes versicolor FP-101664 SS1]|uniref:Uncharacterized protein n=1 Tax=Trametes versicolor (strain FP-101664) TaxID=717944 RepID=R7S605_TRAVS|nr:uncharacterized protein TRAVEDRAFT_54834 [Trametes versicolor FP-101664 SS1]EIW51158.1 hypothetical protein TRAVEDRAFT_54834 [Trametes versicolor FP-101664 SS1]
MSSAQSLNIAQAIDIVIGFHDENIAIAAVILDQVMDHLVTLGFPSSPVLWPRAAEELVTKTHRDYKINALRVLRTSVALVRCSGGLDSLVDQVDTSLNMGDEVAEMFNQNSLRTSAALTPNVFP